MTDRTNPDRLDPELEGLPTVADDTSTAYDEGDHPRFDDGTPIPRDRWVPVDDGAGLDVRLRQEMPDNLEDISADADEDSPDALYDDELAQPVGRLLGSPIEAFDSHERGGLSAEEAAMHLVDERPTD